jgi:hypothetical protein
MEMQKYMLYFMLFLGQAVMNHLLAQDTVSPSVIACALDRVDILYVGIDNPITIAVSEVSPNKVKVSCEGCTLTSNGIGKYNAVVRVPGAVAITVAANGMTKIFRFQAQYFPNPVPTLSMKKGGAMGMREFCAQAGIIPVLENMGFDAKCSVQSFTIARVVPNQTPITVSVLGTAFDEKAQKLICAAKPGDLYHFSDIKVKCPGDEVVREIGTMSFFVK